MCLSYVVVLFLCSDLGLACCYCFIGNSCCFYSTSLVYLFVRTSARLDLLVASPSVCCFYSSSLFIILLGPRLGLFSLLLDSEESLLVRMDLLSCLSCLMLFVFK